jgi:hypothetical protein
VVVRFVSAVIIVASFAPLASAQGTGAVVGTTPGSALHQSVRANPVPVPEITCASPDPPDLADVKLPDLIFFRMMGSLVCLLHSDGTSEKIVKVGPWATLSPNGNDLAYWIPEEHALHHYSIRDRKDAVLDTIPGATMSRIVWSREGRTVAYQVFGNENLFGIRTINLDSHEHVLLPPTVGRFVSVPDASHVIVAGDRRMRRIELATRKAEPVTAVDGEEAAFSARGGWTGGLTAKRHPAPAPADTAPADDDEVDCTGAVYDLTVRQTASKRSRIVPFPKTFDSILDFEFSPDERSIAVTFGAASCDYPGDKARVFLVSLPDLSLRPISPADRLSVEAHWTPDSAGIVYADYTEGSEPIMLFNVRTGRTVRLTNPRTNGPDEWLGWR